MEDLKFSDSFFHKSRAEIMADGQRIEAECKRIMRESEIISRKIRRENALRDLCISIGCDLYTVSVGRFAELLNTKKREMGL